jgi:hypothetical protein
VSLLKDHLKPILRLDLDENPAKKDSYDISTRAKSNHYGVYSLVQTRKQIH